MRLTRPGTCRSARPGLLRVGGEVSRVPNREICRSALSKRSQILEQSLPQMKLPEVQRMSLLRSMLTRKVILARRLREEENTTHKRLKISGAAIQQWSTFGLLLRVEIHPVRLAMSHTSECRMTPRTLGLEVSSIPVSGILKLLRQSTQIVGRQIQRA